MSTVLHASDKHVIWRVTLKTVHIQTIAVCTRLFSLDLTTNTSDHPRPIRKSANQNVCKLVPKKEKTLLFNVEYCVQPTALFHVFDGTIHEKTDDSAYAMRPHIIVGKNGDNAFAPKGMISPKRTTLRHGFYCLTENPVSLGHQEEGKKQPKNGIRRARRLTQRVNSKFVSKPKTEYSGRNLPAFKIESTFRYVRNGKSTRFPRLQHLPISIFQKNCPVMSFLCKNMHNDMRQCKTTNCKPHKKPAFPKLLATCKS